MAANAPDARLRMRNPVPGPRGGGLYELPPLTAAGIVGATFSVIHGQLLQHPFGPLSALLNPSMATIVLPCRGRAAAARELARLDDQGLVENAGNGTSANQKVMTNQPSRPGRNLRVLL